MNLTIETESGDEQTFNHVQRAITDGDTIEITFRGYSGGNYGRTTVTGRIVSCESKDLSPRLTNT